MRINHKWTEEERDIIRREYCYTHQSRRDLAAKLSYIAGDKVTDYGVAGQISTMGIAKRDDRRPWTPEEKEKLSELIPQYCPRRVAGIMHRSLNSVVVQSKRLHISRRARDGWFTKREVCEIFGVDHKWVQRRIDSGALPASYHYDTRPQQLGGSAWHIEERDLKDFISQHSSELNGRNVDLITIVWLLIGAL